MHFEHCTLEWLWNAPPWQEAAQFVPSYVIYRPDGTTQRHQGSSAEVTVAMTALGREGFEVVACVASGNWILWTLKRRIGPAGWGAA